jgi:hypothetical protein
MKAQKADPITVVLSRAKTLLEVIRSLPIGATIPGLAVADRHQMLSEGIRRASSLATSGRIDEAYWDALNLATSSLSSCPAVLVTHDSLVRAVDWAYAVEVGIHSNLDWSDLDGSASGLTDPKREWAVAVDGLRGRVLHRIWAAWPLPADDETGWHDLMFIWGGVKSPRGGEPISVRSYADPTDGSFAEVYLKGGLHFYRALPSCVHVIELEPQHRCPDCGAVLDIEQGERNSLCYDCEDAVEFEREEERSRAKHHSTNTDPRRIT